MAAKHTPGPWVYADRYIVGEQTGEYICEMSGSASNPDHQADASLIAAAPELLEIVRDVRDYGVSKFSGRIRDVLAKIDGEP
jgi:hypothetical protein